MRVIISKAFIIFVIFFQISAFKSLAISQILKTNEWVSFFSAHTRFNGARIPLGAVIDAYDPDSVHCGAFTVTSVGQYGFLSVYRDDPFTPNVDEGASPGDTIIFRINGILARTWGPEPHIWTFNGDRLEVDLSTNCRPVVVKAMSDITMKEDDPTLVIADLDTIFSDMDNDTLRYSSQCSVPFVKDSIDAEHRALISIAPNWYGEATLIYSAVDPWGLGDQDTVIVRVLSINDPPVITEIPDISFRNDSTVSLAFDPYVEDVDDPDSTLNWIATIVPDRKDSVVVQIDSKSHIVTFLARHNFQGLNEVIFQVTDDSLASDSDTIQVRIYRPTAVETADETIVPEFFSISQNCPNPFNPTTTIQYQISRATHVTLTIYNLLGRKIHTLIDREQQPGYYSVHWDGKDITGLEVASGSYLYVIQAGEFKDVKKMVLLR